MALLLLFPILLSWMYGPAAFKILAAPTCRPEAPTMPSLGPSSSSRSLATVSKIKTHASSKAIRLANCGRAGLHGQGKECDWTWHAWKT